VRPIISDRPYRTWQTGRTTLALLLAAALGLAGCGGGGGGGGGGTDTTASTTTTTTPDDGSQTPDNSDGPGTDPNASTLLNDNPLAGVASFDNFTPTGVQLTVARILADKGVTFAGSPVFLKLARSGGSASCNGDNSSDDKLLFLGQVNPDQSLDLLVDLPLDTVALCYEIFSPLDDTLFGEITL
jgi:hypothetical protein